MFEIALSTAKKDIDRDLFASCREAGISALEISCDYDRYQYLDYKEIRTLSEEYSVNLWSYHLPFVSYDQIDISKKELAEGTVSYWSELIKKASDIGIDKFVVHPSGGLVMDEEREERLKCSEDSLAKLADIAKTQGAVIAVEGLPRTCLGNTSDEINRLISVHEDLGVCFDSNHMLKETPENFVRKVGNRIITTHISDYDFVDEKHWLPGEGLINWTEVLKALKEIGYQGMWLYEISFKCPDTITRDRDLTCEDCVKNAKVLFGTVV